MGSVSFSGRIRFASISSSWGWKAVGMTARTLNPVQALISAGSRARLPWSMISSGTRAITFGVVWSDLEKDGFGVFNPRDRSPALFFGGSGSMAPVFKTGVFMRWIN